MAKGSRSRRGRVTTDNAKRSLPLSQPYRLSAFDRRRQMRFSFMQETEDRRTWHPEGPQRPARSLYRARHWLTLAQPRKANQRPSRGVPVAVGFEDARNVLICQRRQRRREVLHALRKAGKTGQRRPRRSWYSSVSCRGGKKR